MGAEIPLQPMVTTMVTQVVLLQSMDIHDRAHIHLQPMEDQSRQMHPKGICDPVERSPRWSRFSGRTCGPTGDPCWSSLFLKDCTLWTGSMLEQFVTSCSPWKDPCWRSSLRTVSCWWDPTLEQGKRVRRKEQPGQGVMN
ncbi:hypothetical protein AV530_014056 [Patagioenas fasciata monilis]|uniref:Uncharacterized protein n=1 Tax=Patagioenas fasciata monilis TaxID=372326 RepID=A0A1V4JVZ6_PATFA|nr:hypothetical protein AV530_014056 [Patagioenas fasciata monilis]